MIRLQHGAARLLMGLALLVACGPAAEPTATAAPAASPARERVGPDPALQAAVVAAAAEGDLEAITALVTAAVDSRPCVRVGELLEAAIERLPEAAADQRDELRCLKYAEMSRRRHCGPCTTRGSALGYLAGDCSSCMILHSCDLTFEDHRCPPAPQPPATAPR